MLEAPRVSNVAENGALLGIITNRLGVCCPLGQNCFASTRDSNRCPGIWATPGLSTDTTFGSLPRSNRQNLSRQPVPQYVRRMLVINIIPVRRGPTTEAPDPSHPGGFVIDPMWHLDEKHSQLAAARDHFERPGEGIIIGHVDNGLDGRHSAAPFRLQCGDSFANAVGLMECAQKQSRHELASPPLPPELTGAAQDSRYPSQEVGSLLMTRPSTVATSRVTTAGLVEHHSPESFQSRCTVGVLIGRTCPRIDYAGRVDTQTYR